MRVAVEISVPLASAYAGGAGADGEAASAQLRRDKKNVVCSSDGGVLGGELLNDAEALASLGAASCVNVFRRDLALQLSRCHVGVTVTFDTPAAVGGGGCAGMPAPCRHGSSCSDDATTGKATCACVPNSGYSSR